MLRNAIGEGQFSENYGIGMKRNVLKALTQPTVQRKAWLLSEFRQTDRGQSQQGFPGLEQ